MVTDVINTSGGTDTVRSFQCYGDIQGEDIVKRSYFQICISLLEFAKHSMNFHKKNSSASLSIHHSWSVLEGVVLIFIQDQFPLYE